MEIHFLPLVLYSLIYIVIFVIPLGKAGRVWGALNGLQKLIQGLDEAKKTARAETVRRERLARVAEGDGLAEGEENAELPTPTLSETRRQRAKRFERPAVLQQSASYDHLLVKEAAAYFRARYPAGDFRQFEIERLPAFATYVERFRAARGGAALFVLSGLLGTMIKIESVVGEIGGLAGTGAMEADAFLRQMSTIMDDTGGAFMSSIIGLLLMLLALVVISILDRMIQRGTDQFDHEVQTKLVPGLVDLHEIQNPNLSVSDLLSETGEILGRLNGTVGNLTTDLNASLSGLGTRIEKMMHEFDAFTTQYAKLSDLLDTLKAAGQNMGDVTKAINTAANGLERAAKSLRSPIDDLNDDLREAIGAQATVTAEGLGRLLAAQAEGVDGLGDRLTTAYEQLASAQRSLREEIHTMQKSMTDASLGLRSDLKAHLEQNGADHSALIAGVRAQAAAFDTAVANADREMKAVAEALRAADSQKLAGVVDRVGTEVGASASKLSASARQLESAAGALREGTGSTLFGWTQQQIRKLQK